MSEKFAGHDLGDVFRDEEARKAAARREAEALGGVEKKVIRPKDDVCVIDTNIWEVRAPTVDGDKKEFWYAAHEKRLQASEYVRGATPQEMFTLLIEHLEGRRPGANGRGGFSG